MFRLALQWRFLKTGFPLLVLFFGSVFAAGQLAATSTSVNFGNVQVGKTASQSFVLTDPTNWNISISQVTVTGAVFTVNGLAVPALISAGSGATVTVAFAPPQSGSFSGSVSFTFSTIKNNNGNSKRTSLQASTLTVSLSGVGVTPGALAATPASESFATQVGTTQTAYQVLANSGGSTVTMSQASVTGAGFAFSGLSLPTTLTPGQSVSFMVSFSPAAAGSAAGSITVLSNATNPTLTIPLSGTATSPGQLTITPTSANFGTVTIGTSATQSGSLGASGSGVTVSSGSINNSEFLLSGIALPATLAAGQSISFTVTFTPQISGTALATLSFASNASTRPTASLTGTGSAPVQHSVGLTWSNSSTGVVGYNVYRATLSGGPYAVINPGLNPTTAYTDGDVLAGQTYYYVVTAVDGNGVESAYSNQVQAAVPSP